MTFRAYKVTYKIVFFVCKLYTYIKYVGDQNLRSGAKIFLLVASWLPNEKVNFDRWPCAARKISQKPNDPLLTKLFQSRLLDTGLVLYLRVYGP